MNVLTRKKQEKSVATATQKGAYCRMAVFKSTSVPTATQKSMGQTHVQSASNESLAQSI